MKLPQVTKYPCAHCCWEDSMGFCSKTKTWESDRLHEFECEQLEYEDWVEELVMKVLEEYLHGNSGTI